MRSKGMVLGAALGLALIGSMLAPAASHAQVQRPAPTARPDLALSTRDLPPGYEEGTRIGITVREVPLQDRMLKGSDPGLGPVIILSMTFDDGMPADGERVDRLGRDFS